MFGMIGLHYIDWWNKTTEIGYWLSEEQQGNGIMTRTVNSLIQHCFNELDLNRIIIRAASENTQSCAIPARLGFIEEGILREAQFLHGKYHDLVHYSKLRGDQK
ncbi:GNAT family N-acetyltransferase [Mesobacillus zeae]|uniref:GNAT family N-acetyltransferase n=1 Tax=Mesobacillus zeae TaxID=1917180 RepID=UPI002174EB91